MVILVEKFNLPDVNAAYNMVTQDVPMGRAATAVDVANVVLYLASSQAAMVTGSYLMVDGCASAVDLPTIAFAPAVER